MSGAVVPPNTLERRTADRGLPLLRRARDQVDQIAYVTPRLGAGAVRGDAAPGGPSHLSRMPARALEPGEQYRFHFDMRKCIGCKCCVVACNEQNGNPASINWRRVGELEGGFFPQATRSFLSMGCNHCLEPTCLTGCPVDAYAKDAVTGIVRHSSDACIGCQYCTWNCSYGVPQYNPERGVVGKCDMCQGRLSLGQAPACVSACPEGAIEIEIVKTADWRTAVAAAVQQGLPAADGSLSTTRVSLPSAMPPNTRPRDLSHVVAEHAHASLIVMTVLTQLSVGAFVAIWLLQLLGESVALGRAAVVSLAVGSLALAAATLHLGRPIHAYRALRMWRRSWLSREVLLFAAFSKVAAAYAALLWFDVSGSAAVGGVTALLGIAGVTASACIYRVPSRPAWNTRFTVVEFGLTAGIVGGLFVWASTGAGGAWVVPGIVACATAQLLVQLLRFFRCMASENLALRGTARLLSTVFSMHFVARAVLLVAGGIVLPLFVGGSTAGSAEAVLYGFGPLEVEYSVIGRIAALLSALASESLGRYLFFVSVVPTHLAAPYLAAAREAA